MILLKNLFSSLRILIPLFQLPIRPKAPAALAIAKRARDLPLAMAFPSFWMAVSRFLGQGQTIELAPSRAQDGRQYDPSHRRDVFRSRDR